VCLTVPILLANVGFFAEVAPQLLPALWSAAWRQEHLTSAAVGHGEVVQTVNQGIGLMILTATAAGLVLTAGFLFFRLGRLVARLAGPRTVPAIYRHTHRIYLFAVSLPLASIVAMALGFLQQAAPLVLASIVFSTVAALALTSLILVNRHSQ
jgi:hypothetical protein